LRTSLNRLRTTLWRLLPRLFAASGLCVGAVRADAQISAGPAPSSSVNALYSPGRDVTISLLTVGDGDRLWQMFGHTAVRIHNNATGRDTVFNWGAFDFSQPHFLFHFLRGLNFYQMAGGTLAEIVDDSRQNNRTIVSQELDLTTAQKDALLQIIRTNARPENITYRYDYFRNNCATRPRDIIDQILGGALHDHSKQVTEHSYRWHALDHMQSDKLLVIGVDIGLGTPSDRPITRWDEMFLPRELHDVVATTQVRDSTGTVRPLIRGERVLFQSTRPPEPAGPPNLAVLLLAIGLPIGIAFLLLGTRSVEAGRVLRMTTSVLLTVWSLAAGLVGLVLTLLWIATDHVFAHGNANLLVFNPLWLALVVMLPLTFMSGKATRGARLLTTTTASLCVLALIAHVIGLTSQSNLAVVALGLPPALAIWLVVRRMPGGLNPLVRRQPD